MCIETLSDTFVVFLDFACFLHLSLVHAVPAGEVHSRLEDLQRRGQRQQRRPHAPSKDLDSARTNTSDSPQSATEREGSTSADATAQSGSGSHRDLEASRIDEAQGSANGQPTKQSESEADMHRSSETAQPAAEPSTGQGGRRRLSSDMRRLLQRTAAVRGTNAAAAKTGKASHAQAGDEGLWADMAEEYCGTEEEHLEAALHEDTKHGQTCGISPADSAEVRILPGQTLPWQDACVMFLCCQSSSTPLCILSCQTCGMHAQRTSSSSTLERDA